jgi:hypothetical protein
VPELGASLHDIRNTAGTRLGLVWGPRKGVTFAATLVAANADDGCWRAGPLVKIRDQIVGDLTAQVSKWAMLERDSRQVESQ